MKRIAAADRNRIRSDDRLKSGGRCLMTCMAGILLFSLLSGCAAYEKAETNPETALHVLEDAAVSEGEQNNQTEGNNTPSSASAETFPTGTYYYYLGGKTNDGSSYKAHELIISENDGENYTVDFGMYKAFYMSNGAGCYDADTGVLSFTGTDDTGHTMSADVETRGDHLIVTLTHYEYPDFQAGSTFEFVPEGREFEPEN